MYKQILLVTATLVGMLSNSVVSAVEGLPPINAPKVHVLIDVKDPTQPKQWIPQPAKGQKKSIVQVKKKVRTPRVTFIKYSEQKTRRQALIDGKMLGIGDQVRGFTVSQIKKDRVILTRKNRQIVSVLNSSAKRIHIVKTSPRP